MRASLQCSIKAASSMDSIKKDNFYHEGREEHEG
jgi:hypothetical protein